MASTALAAPQNLTAAPGDEFLFTADEIIQNQETNLTIAKGHVEVIHGVEVLMADKLTYDRTNDRITAEGNVSYLQASGDVLFADHMTMTSDFAEGTARNIRLLMTDDSRAAAVRAVRTGGRETTLYKGVYSPCKACEDDPDRPLMWQIKAAEIRHDQKQKQIEYKDAFLEILGVPVMYTPYFFHPDPTVKRQSGLLFPSYGSNANLGPFAKTPYYWALSPSSDATVTPTLYFNQPQLVLDGEYRRHFENGTMTIQGSGTYITQDNAEGGTTPGKSEFRGHIDGKGRFDIDDTWRWGFDLARTTDDTYLRRYGYEWDTPLTSRAFVEGFRGRNYATADLMAFQNLRADRDESHVPDIAGFAEYSYVGKPAKRGAYWTVDTTGMAVTRTAENDTFRLTGEVGWHLPYIAPSGEIYALDASLQSSFYAVKQLKDPINGRRNDEMSIRAQPQLYLSWRYPMVRTHDTVSEVLEPMIGIKLAPNSGQDSDIPNEDSTAFQFDDSNLFNPSRYPGLDRVDGGQRIDYGLTWSAYGASGGWSQAFIGQSFRLQDDDTYPDQSGVEDRLSDIVGRVQIQPNSFLKFEQRFRLDHKTLDPLQGDTRLQIGPSALRLNLSYTFVDSAVGAGDFGDREEIRGSLNAQLSRNWSAAVGATRRLSEPRGMEALGLKFAYQDDCLTFTTKFSRSYYSDRDIKPDDSIFFTLVFKNLGAVTSPRLNIGADNASGSTPIGDDDLGL